MLVKQQVRGLFRRIGCTPLYWSAPAGGSLSRTDLLSKSNQPPCSPGFVNTCGVSRGLTFDHLSAESSFLATLQ